jgi:hypothetical protein
MVGAPFAKLGSATLQGAVYVFQRSGSTWSQVQKLVASDGVASDVFGTALATSGDTLLVGAPGRIGTTHPGAVYVYTYSAGSWRFASKLVPPAAAGDGAGARVAIGSPFAGIAVQATYASESAGDVYVFSGAAGEACTSASECKSGHRVDGVCCDSACSGPCQACSAAKKGAGANGTCGPIASGTDPDSECPGPTCAAAVVTNKQVCDGAGACRSNGTTACSGTQGCAGSACGACSLDRDCASTAYCAPGGACTTKLDPGAGCTDARQCKSGVCADGVCCDKACGGCNAYSAAKKGSGVDGTCGPVAAGTDPQNACTPDAGYPQSCLGDGTCDGKGACRTFAPAGVVCSANGKASCAGNTVFGSVCSGSGPSRAGSMAECPSGFMCNAAGDGCLTTCSGDGDCIATFTCSPTSKTCIPKRSIGDACSGSGECVNDLCVDGYYCDSACDSQCAACDVAGSLGKCTRVTGKPHGTRKACDGGGSACEGSCNGIDVLRCDYPSPTTECGATCEGGQLTKSTCDGKGICVKQQATSCPANLACDGEGKCKVGTCRSTSTA